MAFTMTRDQHVAIAWAVDRLKTVYGKNQPPHVRKQLAILDDLAFPIKVESTQMGAGVSDLYYALVIPAKEQQ